MLKLHDISHPGVMISQVWPNSREKEGATLKAIESVIELDFFTAFQTVEVPYKEERLKIGKLIKENGYTLANYLTRVLNENRLNLSDLDETNRKKSYEKVIACIQCSQSSQASF